MQRVDGKGKFRVEHGRKRRCGIELGGVVKEVEGDFLLCTVWRLGCHGRVMVELAQPIEHLARALALARIPEPLERIDRDDRRLGRAALQCELEQHLGSRRTLPCLCVEGGRVWVHCVLIDVIIVQVECIMADAVSRGLQGAAMASVESDTKRISWGVGAHGSIDNNPGSGKRRSVH